MKISSKPGSICGWLDSKRKYYLLIDYILPNWEEHIIELNQKKRFGELISIVATYPFEHFLNIPALSIQLTNLNEPTITEKKFKKYDKRSSLHNGSSPNNTQR